MPDTYTSQFSGEEIDAAVRAAQIISGADTPAELRKKLEIRGDTIPVSAEDPTSISGAVKYRTNPNLLDNWYFGRPVNQRGQTEYTECLYTIDRWLFDNDSGTVTANLTQEGVRFSASSGAAGIASLRQTIDPENINALAGKTVTLSCLGKTDISQQVIFFVDNQVVTNVSSTPIDGVCMTTCTYTFPTVMSSLAVFLYARSISGAGEGSILAAKLELGDTQTLAHKENGVWVLNEIPDFGEQLRRCQRYFQRHHIDVDSFYPAVMYQHELDRAHFNIPLHGKMRTKPTARFDGSGRYVTATFSQFYNTSILLDTRGTAEDLAAITVIFNALSAATSGWVDSIGDVDFSADL